MIKRLNKFSLMVLAVGAVLLAFLVSGSNAQANVDPIGAKATINIIDTQGNVLKEAQTITYNTGVKNVNVTVPGYPVADTLNNVVLQYDNSDLSPVYKSRKFTVNEKDQTVDAYQTYIDNRVPTTNSESKKDLQKKLGVTITSMSDGLAKFFDFMRYGITFYRSNAVSLSYLASGGVPTSFTVVYDYQEATIPVEYVNDNNGSLIKTDTIKGFLGEKGAYTPVAPSGYQLVTNSPVRYDLSSKANAKMTIHLVPIPVTPVTPTPTPTSTQTPTTPTNPYWNPTTNKPADGKTGLPEYANVKKTAVYAVKSIYMYSSPNFTKHNRVAKYNKQKRVNRPMFIVTGYARSNTGTLRYKVRDANQGSRNYGKTGYITARRAYVLNLYYRSMPKNNKITVIAKGGVNAYKTTSLTGKTAHYKKGTRLHVKKLVKHNLTTRYQLTNGRYVSANKTLVIQGNY
ncbi:DUF5776 domain-containing protein [Lentilactobacillus sunkii]|uniref:DUF5776 domain-containing protein n=1 Tax=Lentilactobacillus sunkii DSM 19904 TaxID=1423808 RepID=A0A0R1L4H9_9LACO|nr:hypothetical protein FD17_GL000668 [Lentilactobacillus sunkii DSM 19904]